MSEEEKLLRVLTEALLQEMFEEAWKDPYPEPPIVVASKAYYDWWVEQSKK